MTTRSHFLSLFRRGNRFKFSKKTSNIEKFFKKSLGFKLLKEIAKETAFEPTFIGVNNNNEYQLIIEYNLIFPNWTQVLEPIIIFYKEFIDEFY